MFVSIITPTFNRAGFLAETMDSILKQSYTNFEYIILDDGSTDDTAAVLSKYQDPRIKIFHHENMGESKTVNKGLSLAKGEIIGVVNSDDPLLPGALWEAVEAFRKFPAVLATYPDWLVIGPDGEYVEPRKLKAYTVANMLAEFNFALGPGAFIRSSVFKTMPFRNPHLRFTGDMDFWLRLALRGKMHHLPQLLATHRIHADSASIFGTGKQMAKEMVTVVKSILDDNALPMELKKIKNKILARVYYVCAYGHSGKSTVTKLSYYFASLFHRIAQVYA